jgi:hypothetical protein
VIKQQAFGVFTDIDRAPMRWDTVNFIDSAARHVGCK